MATTEATQEEQPLSWREKLLKNWMLTRLAHEGAMIDKLQQQQKRMFQVADLALTGKAGEESVSANGDEDMGVSIGNEIHYHYQGGDATNTAPAAAAAPSSGISTLGKTALAAALIGGGGAGGYVLNQYLNPDTPAAVDTDTDTRTDVTFPE